MRQRTDRAGERGPLAEVNDTGTYRFDQFLIDVGDRRLLRGEEPVEIRGRYLDALALLVREQGRLVTKDRFLDEVWRGVPVTDEALTQCIKTLRRELGDDAARPRFIETVPRHGYRFIAAVEPGGGSGTDRSASGLSPLQRRLLVAGGGVVGAGLAGLVGGLVYGLAATSQPLMPGMGAISVLLVLVCLTILVALMGGAGVAVGMALAAPDTKFSARSMIGGGLGGFAVGTIVKLLGLDAFNLLLGQSPGDITGGTEGAFLGAAIGLGAWLGERRFDSLRGTAGSAAFAAAVAGLVIPLLGGRLMGGSLDLLGHSLDRSRLRFDRLGAMFGEQDFGLVSQAVTGMLEGALFSFFLVAAMILARRSFPARPG